MADLTELEKLAVEIHRLTRQVEIMREELSVLVHVLDPDGRVTADQWEKTLAELKRLKSAEKKAGQ